MQSQQSTAWHIHRIWSVLRALLKRFEWMNGLNKLNKVLYSVLSMFYEWINELMNEWMNEFLIKQWSGPTKTPCFPFNDSDLATLFTLVIMYAQQKLPFRNRLIFIHSIMLHAHTVLLRKGSTQFRNYPWKRRMQVHIPTIDTKELYEHKRTITNVKPENCTRKKSE